MKSFSDLNINENIIKGLKTQEIKIPTKIQEKSIPYICENKDVVAESETGSGKTLAYLLPLFQKIDVLKRENQAIILTPTHELAVQVQKVIDTLSKNSNYNITSSVIIGNVNIKRQVEKLKEKPHIIVGSTGRILELIKMKKISAHTVKTIIIDECDKLLDINNIENTKAVIKTTLRERQILCFSATLTEEVINFSKEIMKKPIIIKSEAENIANKNIDHIYFLCDRRDKIIMVRKLVAALNPKKAIVFINKSDEIEIMAEKLRYHKLKAQSIHGTSFKSDRKKAMDAFISGKSNILVSSDLSSRGLDIKDVTHVINLDLPENPMDYIHRVGRCGRGNERGVAISIVTEKEENTISQYKKKFKISIDLKDIYYGKVINPKEKQFMKKEKCIEFKNKNKNNKRKDSHKSSKNKKSWEKKLK
ncbi:MAG: DEAD/DEAH box helicase [Clostridium argentinense]|uniref:DEAD/DEAH box helicase n=1 Tax=Clostridium faecium TaxID=2762223 RepID=A0ABR8YQC4_9CLOT|nr:MULTISPECIES: DEAD/DEAH box helicase [Clostridium]MBD8046347.1 DEAD/DEAH box helicase [Clostridium faecium]MBS5823793.1 DEAD/DEAH box helicase [Clostridium argentinense]MDU1350175.1 DEAD/DEAH box helicase [Clostridium argentinense]